MLQDKIKMNINWNKVDSHIDKKTYKDRKKADGDEKFIRLNKVVDGRAGETREGGEK